MKYTFSNHANEQIARRSIFKEFITETISSPESIIKHDDYVNVFQKVMAEGKNKYLYRVFINVCKKPALIITVYKTSKIEKYENKIW